MEREKLSGTLLLWPGVAEELLAGKAYFVRAGVFKDVDVCIFAHVGDGFGVRWGEATASSGWCRSSTRSPARPRTRPARRGAAARRSTPSS